MATQKFLDSEGLKKVKADYVGRIDKKVEKETGKGLSTNDYDNTAKGIVDGVTANLNNKVDKAEGKDLIETAKVTKLDGIADGAQVNVIESISVNGQDAQISAKKATVTLDIPSIEGLAKSSDLDAYLTSETASGTYATKSELGAKLDATEASNTYATKASVASALIYKGSVNTYTELPQSGQTQGDFYNVTDTDMNYAWNGTAWDPMAPTTDLSGKADRTELPEALSSQEIEAILAD